MRNAMAEFCAGLKEMLGIGEPRAPDASGEPIPVGSERRFLLRVSLVFLSGLAGAGGLIGGTLHAGREHFAYQQLVDYQMQKLAKTDVDTVFIGDSSLGNAIDAGEWQRATGNRGREFRPHRSVRLCGLAGDAGKCAAASGC